LREILAGKSITVSEAVGDLVHLGACQNRAGLTEYPLLRLNFSDGFGAGAGAALRTNALDIKPAHFAVDTTGGS